MSGLVDTSLPCDPLEIAEKWLAEGRKVALATVVDTWGSAPRPAGSHLVIDADGNFQGSVSGGCVEGAVITEALDVIGSGSVRTLDFGVEDETAWKVGLSCGGRIRVHVRRLEGGQPSGYPQSPDGLLTLLNAERRARRPVVVATDLRDGAAQLIRREDEAPRDICEAVRAAFETGRSRHVEAAGQSLFLNAYLPQPRLVVIGAVHISQALVPMARIAGFPVEIIDPRTAFATPERFPEVTLHASWPQEVFAAQPLDSRTALAALTHDPRIDDLPLQAALEAGCFYVGVLGSRKLSEQRNERLLAAGVSRDLLGRIRSPIGLNISAANPAEIAVAVLAEVISASRSRDPTSLLHR